MKFKKVKKIPDEFMTEISKQNSARARSAYNAMKATELHKYYIESGAQFKMTFSQFKRKNKGKIR